MAYSKVPDEVLIAARNKLVAGLTPGRPIRAWIIKELIKKEMGIDLDESTIRGRFIELGMPLSGKPANTSTINSSTAQITTTPSNIPSSTSTTFNFNMMDLETAQKIMTEIKKPKEPEPKPEPEKPKNKHIQAPKFDVPDDLKGYIPNESLFEGYVERSTDQRLAIAYLTHKHPLSQGKQGTGKTLGHMYFAFKNKLPFMLISCYPDMKLNRLFGDKTIINGSVVFQESVLVKMIQNPSVILFDEINYITNANSVDFHALLQNRELFVKDADNGVGKIFKLHPQCYVGFAQNPRGVKYVGPNIKPASFVGRCTYLTYPDFDRKEIKTILLKKYMNHNVPEKFIEESVGFYFACLEAIENSEIPVDFSLRQLSNMIDLYINGLSLAHAIEDGIISMLEAVSQPKTKESFWRLAQATWSSLVKKEERN